MFLSPGSSGRGRSSSAGPSSNVTPRSNSPMFPQHQFQQDLATGRSAPPLLPSRSNASVSTDSARVIHGYTPAAQDVGDLELTPGEIITNIDTRGEPADQGWWLGYNPKGESGLFPSTYVELIQRPPSRCKPLDPQPAVATKAAPVTLQQSRPVLQTPVQGSSYSLPGTESTSTFTSAGAPSTHRELGTSMSEVIQK